ncbi:ComF family protein [Candidatus Peregrinibacteria bacterium]|nr:ComF family protein [Candidatus Peregrinibacteria bacterium]
MRIITFLLDTLFPPTCASCKKEGAFLCEDCVRAFKKRKIRPRPSFVRLPKEFAYMDGVIYALDYAKNPGIQAAIQQFKYKFTRELAAYFADLVSEKLGQLSMAKNGKIILIPVPLHPKRLNYRGFNQAEVIGRAVGERMGDRVEIIPLLARVRHTAQQAKLTKKERHANLENAFILNKKCVHKFEPGKSIYFIVDDVCTTGATLENCAKVLKENGFKKVYGLVVARAFK